MIGFGLSYAYEFWTAVSSPATLQQLLPPRAASTRFENGPAEEGAVFIHQARAVHPEILISSTRDG
jgi:hypothetical protein